jgi:hypothetical protein
LVLIDLGEIATERTLVAEVNGQLWDMHRPLEDSCALRLLHTKMKDEDPYQVCNNLRLIGYQGFIYLKVKFISFLSDK